MSEFLYMGGYAFYVWCSYGLAAVILLANIVVPVLKHQSNLLRADDFQQQNGERSNDA